MFDNIVLNYKKGVIIMTQRKDYYEFSHKLLPESFFNYSKQIIQKLEKDPESFIPALKRTWNRTFSQTKFNDISPNFKVKISNNVKNSYSIITIEIPEAKEDLETPFIGITFDANYSIRYFVYEIDKSLGCCSYFLCEWTKDYKHLNYGIYLEKNINSFVNAITNLI
jgi:hypothetical protein